MKLSIITVNLNNRDGFKKTAESIISQTFKDYEWIVIDGGSTDGSKELIEKYANHITYWVSEPDKGIYNAMNKGIKVAKGDYLQFLNSGDIFINNHSLNSVHIERYDQDIVFATTVIFNGKMLKRINIQNDYLTCYQLTKSTISHPSAFIKRDLFDRYGLYDESLKIVSDWKFFFNAIIINKCSKKFVNQEIILFDTNGISSSNGELRRKEREMVYNLYLPEYVRDDYMSRFELNELLDHRFSRAIIGFLYRTLIKLEKWKLLGLIVFAHYFSTYHI